MNLDFSTEIVDEILGAHVAELGTNFVGYRNHVLRMLRFTFAQVEFSTVEKESMLIAGAFHDIGIWTNNTFDYIKPSVKLAQEYLESRGMTDRTEAVTEMIDNHHSLRSCSSPMVEAFRRGDLTDFSLGLVKFGISSETVRSVKDELPNAGFHKGLIRTAAKWVIRQPFNPLPVVKF